LPEISVRFIFPEPLKITGFQIAQAVMSILVETAGNNQAIPGNDTGVPHFPAMIQ
jgi:hypothetical protein